MPEEIPLYQESIQDVIKYPDIEKEVRCGRYYLSVWTEQAKLNPGHLYVIPQSEESEFHMQIQAELK